MATRTIRGGDWIRVAAEQNASCRAKNGVMFGVLGLDLPFTPGIFAGETYRFWNGAVAPVFAAARAEGKFDSGPFEYDGIFVIDDLVVKGAGAAKDFILGEGGDDGLFMSQHPAERAKDSKSIAVKQSCARIDLALRSMLSAMAIGGDPGTRNARGELCLDGINAARFWAAVSSLGREFSFLAANTSVTAREFWEVVQEGAKEGLRDVGKVAGAALAAAGEGAGALVGGFFDELGVVQVAVLVGGAVLVGKVF